MSLRRTVLATFFICLSSGILASHIIGGELKYKDLGEGEYEITLVVYRDCSGVDFANPVNIQIWGLSETSGLIESTFSINIPLLSSDIVDVPVVLGNPCGIPPQGICIQEATYRAVVILPLNEYGWDLSYADCCRTPSSVNIDWDLTSGAVYAAHIPGVGNGLDYVLNTPPEFNLKPPTAICSNLDFFWDHSATDADGDSLVYELCTPFADILYSPYVPGSEPFLPVIYAPGFSSVNPIASDPQIAIDSNTGLITGMPNLPGQYAFAVCVSEYRDGVFLGSHQREFQFNVTFCDPNIEATIEDQDSDQLCSGQTLTLGNNSVNGSFYEWDFGVEDDLNDVSTEFEPTFTWPGTGAYDVTLVVNPGWPCADTAQTTFFIADDVESTLFLSHVEGNLLDDEVGPLIGTSTIEYANGDVFPLQDWMAAEAGQDFNWEGETVDAVAIEGCDDLLLTITRSPDDSSDQDTLYVMSSGEVEVGVDVSDVELIVIEPGVTELEVAVQVFNDSLQEGVEEWILSQALYDCDADEPPLLRILILDPVPLSASLLPASCANDSGTVQIGFDQLQGLGPMTYQWSLNDSTLLDEVEITEYTEWSDSLAIYNSDGYAMPLQSVRLDLEDQCGQIFSQTQEFRNFLMHPEEFCVDSSFPFPAFNADLPVLDVLVDGMSMMNDSILVDTLAIDAEWDDGVWLLQGVSTGSFDWTGELTVIDSCGRSSSATLYILEYVCTPGCTDETACNYFGDAGIEDGSCEFPGDPCDDGIEETFGEVFTQNCDCLYQATSTGLTTDAVEMTLMPNPSAGVVRIEGLHGGERIRMRSADGRIVHETCHESPSHGLTLSVDVPNGVYLIEVLRGSRRELGRLVINRQ